MPFRHLLQRLGVAGIERDRVLEAAQRIEDGAAALEQQRPPLEVELVRSGARRAAAPPPVSAGGRQLEPRRDGVRDLVADREHVGRRAVVAPGPELASVRGAHHARRDAQAVLFPAHAAFEQRRDAELLADPARIGAVALECEARPAGRDAQAVETRERGPNLRGETVGVVLVARSADVRERQHRDRLLMLPVPPQAWAAGALRRGRTPNVSQLFVVRFP
jgi:hypothetical protein